MVHTVDKFHKVREKRNKKRETHTQTKVTYVPGKIRTHDLVPKQLDQGSKALSPFAPTVHHRLALSKISRMTSCTLGEAPLERQSLSVTNPKRSRITSELKTFDLKFVQGPFCLLPPDFDLIILLSKASNSPVFCSHVIV